MERVSIHPPVHIQNYIEFDCRDKRDRATSQVTITNHKEIMMVSQEVTPGLQAQND
jgi:hypothetical protein